MEVKNKKNHICVVVFSGITEEPLGPCWSMTSPNTWPMRAWSAGWRSCTNTLTLTSWWCWWATSRTWTQRGPCPWRRPKTLQVKKHNGVLLGYNTTLELRCFSLKTRYFEVIGSKILTKCWQKMCIPKTFCWFHLEKKDLLFLETSALQSTNVEVAFSTILSGDCVCLFVCCLFLLVDLSSVVGDVVIL